MPEAAGVAPPAEVLLAEPDDALPVGVTLEKGELALSVAVENPLKLAVVTVPLELVPLVVVAPLMVDVPDAVPVVDAEEDEEEHASEVPVICQRL